MTVRREDRVSIVSVVGCDTYELDAVRRAVTAALAPLGGIGRFACPGMRVLLKPNLLAVAEPEQAVTTHRAVVQAVVEQVQAAGGTVLIGDSPGGALKNGPPVYRKSGMVDLATQTGASLVPFEEVAWKRLNGADYFIARPVLEADLVINLPKLKTHSLTLFTGAVKNLFGTIPGTRKREVHCRALGMRDFGQVLVDVLELVPTALTIMDGVLGQEGNGPGAGGTPRHYGCLAASADPVALDAVIAQALGYRPGEVLHLAQAEARGLGVSNPEAVYTEGERRVLDFGQVSLPWTRRYLRIPSWVSKPLRRAIRIRPQMNPAECAGCGQCAEACPPQAITPGKPPQFNLDACIGCLCCAEVCPQGSIKPQRNLLARWLGLGL
jgi:uncharacterized protein (DUF362 family)/Pyruvate/2-oxoacid:ferredoxin oxidoreductase delta subunit